MTTLDRTQVPHEGPLSALFGKLVPPANRAVAGWHVSPFVDLLAYQFSWLWFLLPLALLGDLHPGDYLAMWAAGRAVAFLHRQYTMPYVFFDRQVFAQHVTRFTLFFGWLVLGFIASVFLTHWHSRPRFFRPIDAALLAAGLTLVVQAVLADRRDHRFSPTTLVVLGAPFTFAVASGLLGLLVPNHRLVVSLTLVGLIVASLLAAREVRVSPEEKARRGALVFPALIIAFTLAAWASLLIRNRLWIPGVVHGKAIVGFAGLVAAVWNIWHTLMQKFGIMRVYAAKSKVPLEKRTAPWIDRMMIFGTLPLLVVWVGPAQRALLAQQTPSVTAYLLPAVDALSLVQPYLLPLATLLAAVSLGLFVWSEWRADGLRTTPRLTMALGLTALSACFFFVNPLKVYLAYAVSHGVEYMVFVWAFLRRRYAEPQAHSPLIQRALAKPALAYGLFTLPIAAAFLFVEFGDDFGLHAGNLRLFDLRISAWLFSFAIWQSLAHFYFDGFLWKTRRPAMRASL